MDLIALVWLAGAVLVAVLVVGAVLSRRGHDSVALRTLEAVARNLGQLQAELARVARVQDELQHDLHRGREASLKEIADATLGIRGEIGQAQRALAEVKAIEQARARQLDQAADSLKRLEAVLAGSGTRGAAGENILAGALLQLPPDMLESNVAFGSNVVEYALRLPGGRFLPIDSKWTSVGPLQRLAETEDAQERKRLAEQVARDVRHRIRDMSKYLDPERTLSIAVLAVPDAVYAAAPEVRAEGYREGVLVVSYSLAVPCVLGLYRLSLRFGSTVDADQFESRLRTLDETLRRIEDVVEGRLSRGLSQLASARDTLRDHVVGAQRATSRLLQAAEDESVASLAPGSRHAIDCPLPSE